MDSKKSLITSFLPITKNQSSQAPKTKEQAKQSNFKLKRAKVVRDKDSEDINLIKNLEKKGTIFVPDEDLEAKLKTIKEEQEKFKRSYSNDIDSRSGQRYINIKRAKYLYDEDIEEEKLIYIEDKNKINLIKEDELELMSNFMADCNLYDKNNKTYLTGKCFIDKNFTFYFRDEMNKLQFFSNIYYTFPLLSIARCETNSSYFGPSKYCKEIILKDYRNFVFKFSPKSFQEFSEIIEKFVLPKKSIKYFIFAYQFKRSDKNQNKKNIKIYDLIEEFKRQNIDFSTNKQFRILNNNNFQICETYPKRLIVPYDMTNEDLEKSAKFRTKNRLPTLTYRYKNGSCIWRSSQTKTGLKGVKNEYDILLLSNLSNFQKLYVFDARPKFNAMANKLKGGGFENLDDYKNIDIDLIFCEMSNIHAVRNSYIKLLNTVSYNTNSETTLFMDIANSGWYEAILIFLKSSFQIYRCILGNNNVLIHCSDGWDRTSQLCAMSQILLDKYYRTIDGFICLIEKDWMSFGHQFRYRNGFYSPIDSGKSESEFSPIFLQWLDALYQLMEQNYTKFQFNFNLILFLAEELYSGRYGTFLFNNDKEREEFDTENKTVSIWNYIKENENKFINIIYDPEDDGELLINFKTIKIWKDYFYKFEKEDSKNFVLEEYEKQLKKEKNIMKILAKFIAEKNNDKEIEVLDFECKKFIKQFIKK